jgi:hypothetical protein
VKLLLTRFRGFQEKKVLETFDEKDGSFGRSGAAGSLKWCI